MEGGKKILKSGEKMDHKRVKEKASSQIPKKTKQILKTRIQKGN